VARVTLVLGTDGRWVRGIARPAATQAPQQRVTRDPTHGLGCID
jgi:hypothetical protein